MEQLTLATNRDEEDPDDFKDWKIRPLKGQSRKRRTQKIAWSIRLGGILLLALLWGSAWVVHARAEDMAAEAVRICVEKHPYVTKSHEVVKGSTYGTLMEQAGIGSADASAIFAAAESEYDLSKVRLGRNIDLRYDRDNRELLELVYQIDTEEKLHVTRSEDGWVAERRPIEYDLRLRTVEGEIESSLYVSAMEQGLDDRAIVALAEVFQWELDFVMDVRKGDTYRFIFEERYLDGEYVMPGEVKAARFVNAGEPYYAFAYATSDGRQGHFDEEGESVRKMFLKAPVAFKYISSGFTTGLRYVQAFDTYTGHRAIDYAAPIGTPIRAVGDGMVVYSGWNNGYGRFVSVRHNGTYTTNYAHMSRIAVSYGQRVSQGQTIGYVGSTGFSTGPHLHYEMVKHGVKINPLREEFPGVDPIPESEMSDYMKVVEEWKPKLDS